MSLGAIVAGVLPMLREQAESLMTDTCTVHAVTGSTVNAATGVETPTLRLDYTGKCKVQGLDPQESNPSAGGATFTVQRLRVDVPVASFVPLVGHVVTITAAALDANLAGKVFRVTSLLHKSQSTAYRLGVEAIA